MEYVTYDEAFRIILETIKGRAQTIVEGWYTQKFKGEMIEGKEHSSHLVLFPPTHSEVVNLQTILNQIITQIIDRQPKTELFVATDKKKK